MRKLFFITLGGLAMANAYGDYSDYDQENCAEPADHADFSDFENSLAHHGSHSHHHYQTRYVPEHDDFYDEGHYDERRETERKLIDLLEKTLVQTIKRNQQLERHHTTRRPKHPAHFDLNKIRAILGNARTHKSKLHSSGFKASHHGHKHTPHFDLNKIKSMIRRARGHTGLHSSGFKKSPHFNLDKIHSMTRRARGNRSGLHSSGFKKSPHFDTKKINSMIRRAHRSDLHSSGFKKSPHFDTKKINSMIRKAIAHEKKLHASGFKNSSPHFEHDKINAMIKKAIAHEEKLHSSGFKSAPKSEKQGKNETIAHEKEPELKKLGELLSQQNKTSTNTTTIESSDNQKKLETEALQAIKEAQLEKTEEPIKATEETQTKQE